MGLDTRIIFKKVVFKLHCTLFHLLFPIGCKRRVLTFAAFVDANIILWTVDNQSVDVVLLWGFSAFDFGLRVTKIGLITLRAFIGAHCGAVFSVIPFLPLPVLCSSSTEDDGHQKCQDK